MAVTFDAKSSGTGNFVIDVTFTHTPAGTPSAVGIGAFGFNNGSATITATYGGTNVPSFVGPVNDPGADTGLIFGLASPASGAQTVTVHGSNFWYPIAHVVTVTGSDTSTCFSNGNSANAGSGTALSVTTTSATGELVLATGGIDGSGADMTAGGGGSNTTSLYLNDVVGGERASSSLASGASSVTATYTATGSTNWVMMAASFKAAAGAGSVGAGAGAGAAAGVGAATTNAVGAASGTGTATGVGATVVFDAGQVEIIPRLRPSRGPMQRMLRLFNFDLPTGVPTIPASPVFVPGHALRTNMLACYLPGVYSGVPVENTGPTLADGAGGAGTITSTVEGPASQSSTLGAAKGLTATAPSAFKTWTNFTVYWRGLVIGAMDNFCPLVGVSSTNADVAPFFMLNVAGDNTGYAGIRSYYGDSSVGENTGGSDVTALFGQIVDFAATATVGGNVTFYVNGVSVGTGSLTTISTSDATAKIVVNQGIDATSRSPNTSVNMACFWDRALSAGEISGLHSNPYAFLQTGGSGVGSGAGTGTAAAVGTGIVAAVGAASGTGTANALATGTTAATGAASGTGAAAAIGRSDALSVGSGAGTGAAAAAGTGVLPAVGAGSGTGAATATGLAASSAVGAASGTGAAAATGRATTNAVGAGSGVGAASGLADSGVGIGAASGTGRATGVGVALFISVGSASGTGSAAAVGQGVSVAVGAGSATGAANGVGQATFNAIGAASGTGAAATIGQSTAAAVGSGAGAGAAAAVGALGAAGSVGSAAGAGTAAAISRVTVAAIGSAAGMGSAAGASSVVFAGIVATLNAVERADRARFVVAQPPATPGDLQYGWPDVIVRRRL